MFDKKDQSSEPTSNVVLTADNITLDGRLEIKKKVYIDNSKMFPEESMLGADDIFICMSSGSKKHIGKVAFIEHNTGFYAGGFMGILRISTNDCIPKYLYYVLNTQTSQLKTSGAS